jgi:hypothetical protein
MCLSLMLMDAGKPLTSTVISKMDYTLPKTAIGWGYWVLMLAHFATMFNAYRPATLFMGQVGPRHMQLVMETSGQSFET